MFNRRVVASLVCLCLLLVQFVGSGSGGASAAQPAAGHAQHALECDDAGLPDHDCPAAIAPDAGGDECPMTTGGCCPAPAVTRSPADCAQAQLVADEPIAFRTSLHLLSRVEGIFKPPRSFS